MGVLPCDCCSAEIKALFTEWIENRECTLKTKEIADKLIPLMEKCGCDICKQLLELRHSLVKKSQWIFGGDGWGYDIGFGGLDHVLASGEDVNVVVVDTEVYSNTGGQSSKATPAGAVAKFATSGKKIRKTVTEVESRASLLALPRCSNVTESKDLGMIAKSYGYVYVAHEQNCQWPFCHGRQPGPVFLPNDTKACGLREEALCRSNTAE